MRPRVLHAVGEKNRRRAVLDQVVESYVLDERVKSWRNLFHPARLGRCVLRPALLSRGGGHARSFPSSIERGRDVGPDAK
jgi:hypothetical protein